VESYILGLASPEERSEFEAMCRKHPEVLQARLNFELILEKQALENAIEPPSSVKEKLLEEINSIDKIMNRPVAPVRRINWLKYAAAASIILLAGSLYWAVSLKKENERIKADLNGTRNELALVKEDIKVLTGNPGIKMASMKGMEAAPRSFATVYWDTTSHDVYLLINNLPKPPSGKQYQLWALLDGKPLNIGMIDNEYFVKQDRLLVKAKNVQNAQGFAITLEKKGGSPSPEGTMYVLGNL
jgi:anti-sigma-K factor RskA